MAADPLSRSASNASTGGAVGSGAGDNDKKKEFTEKDIRVVPYDGNAGDDVEGHGAPRVADGTAVSTSAARGSVDEAFKVAGEVAMEYTPEEERSVRRKLDCCIPVFCALTYFNQYLDKTLLSYAAVTGLPIKGLEFNQVSAGFYYGYFIFVFPTAWLAQRFPWGTTKYLGINIVCWGTALACSAINPHFVPFFILRILLGMFESCVTVVLLSVIVAFYRKEEQAKRIGVFYSMNGFTQMLGPLIAYGTTFYQGSSFDNQPWRLLYIVFGVFTVVVGVLVYFFMPSNPQHARFLNEREKRIALERVRDNAAGTAQRTFKWSQVREASLELRIWLVFLFVVLTSIPNGGLSSFQSKILKGFGYSSRETLLLQLPSGFISGMTTLLCSWLSDRYQERMLPIMVGLLPTVVAAAILVGYGETASTHKAACVFATFISGTFGTALSIVYAWNATNIGGSSKKAAVYAANMFSFAAGNIAGSFTFRDQDAPQYIPGKVSVLVTLALAAGVAMWLRMLVSRANAAKREQISALKAQHGWDDEEVARQRDAWAFRDLTDRQNPFFVYSS